MSLTPIFFHHEPIDPDELAVLCHARGFRVETIREDTSREGYGYVVREKDTGAYFIHESRSGAVYRVWAQARNSARVR